MADTHPSPALVPAAGGAHKSDLVACQAILDQGSKSFAAAALLLPRRMRAPAAAVYAFCRVADDAVDLGDSIAGAIAGLHRRLDHIYADTPFDDPVDRAFCEVVHHFRIPKTIPLALLEGFQWDAEGRAYESIADLEAYCARVASTVGVMMTLLMGPREPEVLARACDLGLAMQLTNICRDVGEDARAGRLYLPRAWLSEAGVNLDDLGRRPHASANLARVVERVLGHADQFYERADLGISMLPPRYRLAIRAARLIYADIGRVIGKNRFDSVNRRAYTSKPRKAWLLLRSLGSWFWPRRTCAEEPAASVRFLVEAVAEADRQP